MAASDSTLTGPCTRPPALAAALQAKKNVVSGKVFEAHEEISKTQETLRGKDQQIQQLQAVAEHQRGEIEQLKAQLQQAQAQQQLQQQQHPSGRLSDAGTPLRAQLQLPLQQMLAQQQQQHQAAVAALSSRGGGLSESVNGSPMAAAGGGSPFTAGTQGATDSSASKIGRMRIDKTPPRDQDDQFSLAVRVMLLLGQGLAVHDGFCSGVSSCDTLRMWRNA